MMAYILVYLFYLCVPMKKAMHMMQQNRYRKQRYCDWLYKEIKIKYPAIVKQASMLGVCYVLFFVDNRQQASLLGILVFIYAYLQYRIEEKVTYRKPLVWTSRMKRLCACLVVFHVIILYCFLLCSISMQIVVTPILYGLPYLMIILAHTVLEPIEKLIQQMYQKEAKDKLRSMKDLYTIGITGSYGKTSVKTILYYLMQDSWTTLMTPQSYNNPMGITLTIRKYLNRLHEVFLCEMGADHVGDIRELMEFVQPSIGVVTAIGKQHLQTFHKIEHIQQEKMQMVEKLPVDGIAFLNADDPLITSYQIKNTCKIIWYGRSEKANYRYGNVSYDISGSHFTITHNHITYHFHTKLLGEHQIANITAAVAIAHTLDIGWQQLLTQVALLPYIEHRLQKREYAHYTILDDAYNANPKGVQYALEVLKQMKGQRILVTPGMIDLGSLQEQENYKFGKSMNGCADLVILVGEIQTKAIYQGLKDSGFMMKHVHIATSFTQAMQIVEQVAQEHSIVLLENDLPDAFHH